MMWRLKVFGMGVEVVFPAVAGLGPGFGGGGAGARPGPDSGHWGWRERHDAKRRFVVGVIRGVERRSENDESRIGYR